MCCFFQFFFFFFSSRRRHTRWPRDWSSDVCSSDLVSTVRLGFVEPQAFRAALGEKRILSAYLFTGDQDLLKAQAVEALRRAVAGERGSVRSFVGGGVDEILEAQRNLSLLDPVAVLG